MYLHNLRRHFEMAAAYKTTDFVWFKYNGAKAVNVTFDGEKQLLRNGDRFGALEIERGKFKDKMRIVFERLGLGVVTYVSLEGGDKLLDRSRKIKTPAKLVVEEEKPLRRIVKDIKAKVPPKEAPVPPKPKTPSAPTFTKGAYAMMGSIKVQIVSVATNGIKVGYWGKGLKEGEWLEKRVAARYLSPVPVGKEPTPKDEKEVAEREEIIRGVKAWVADYKKARRFGNAVLAKKIRINIIREIDKYDLDAVDIWGSDPDDPANKPEETPTPPVEKPVDVPKKTLPDDLLTRRKGRQVGVSETNLGIAYKDAQTNPLLRLPYLNALWDFYNREKFGNKMRKPNIGLMKEMAANKMRARGYWRGGSYRQLMMSPRTFNGPMDVIHEIFLHEMCHQATHEISKVFLEPNKGHGPVWQGWMVKVGLDPKRFDHRGNDTYMTDEEKRAHETKKRLKEMQTENEKRIFYASPRDIVKYYDSRDNTWTLGMVASHLGGKHDRYLVITAWANTNPARARGPMQVPLSLMYQATPEERSRFDTVLDQWYTVITSSARVVSENKEIRAENRRAKKNMRSWLGI